MFNMIVKNYAPVAQLDRVPGYEPGGREFESLRAHHFSDRNKAVKISSVTAFCFNNTSAGLLRKFPPAHPVSSSIRFSSSGTGTSHSQHRVHTSLSRVPVLTLSSAIRARFDGSSLNSCACSFQDRGQSLRASVTRNNLILGGVCNQVRLLPSSHSDAARLKICRTTLRARLMLLVLIPCLRHPR